MLSFIGVAMVMMSPHSNRNPAGSRDWVIAVTGLTMLFIGGMQTEILD